MRFRTGKEIIEQLELFGCTPSNFDYRSDLWQEIQEVVGAFEIVESQSGEFDPRSRCWYVLNFKSQGIFIRFDGYYESLNGADYENSEFYEVAPRKIEKIAYEPVKDEDDSSTENSGSSY